MCIKILVYDCFGIWLAARRLNREHFATGDGHGETAETLDPAVAGSQHESKRRLSDPTSKRSEIGK